MVCFNFLFFKNENLGNKTFFITFTTMVIRSDDVETRLSNDESCMDESQETRVETCPRCWNGKNDYEKIINL